MFNIKDYHKNALNPYFDDKLIKYRQNKATKTSGNPYYVFGEPIGDLRDNMGCENFDLCPDIEVHEDNIKGIHIRWYQSQNQINSPCVFFIHGGSFIGGSLDVVENPCKYIAKHAQALVINIDYRLAPETVFPNNGEDCIKVIEAILKDEKYIFSREKVYVAGDSAGANLALYCAQKMKYHLSGLLLYYPVVDLSHSMEYWQWHPEKYRGYPNELVKHCSSSLKDSELLMQKLYLQSYNNAKDPLVSPLYIDDMSILPPILIIFAEYDYLYFQIKAFIHKLENQNHAVISYCFEGVNHAFLDLLGIVDQAKNSLDILCSYIK